MSLAPPASLLDPPGAPVLAATVDWMAGTLLGSLAVGLCVVAVASVGLMLLSGRIALREGARVILGCFVLLGAPLIAGGFTGLWEAEPRAIPPPPALPEATRTPLPQSTYDPYAGASLRRD